MLRQLLCSPAYRPLSVRASYSCWKSHDTTLHESLPVQGCAVIATADMVDQPDVGADVEGSGTVLSRLSVPHDQDCAEE